jgi:hypothetical protein
MRLSLESANDLESLPNGINLRFLKHFLQLNAVESLMSESNMAN